MINGVAIQHREHAHAHNAHGGQNFKLVVINEFSWGNWFSHPRKNTHKHTETERDCTALQLTTQVVTQFFLLFNYQKSQRDKNGALELWMAAWLDSINLNEMKRNVWEKKIIIIVSSSLIWLAVGVQWVCTVQWVCMSWMWMQLNDWSF